MALLTQSYPAELEETLLQLGLANFNFEIYRASRRAGALDGEELWPIELLECGTTPAGALDHEELFGIERERRPRFLKLPIAPHRVLESAIFPLSHRVLLARAGHRSCRHLVFNKISTTNQAAPALGP